MEEYPSGVVVDVLVQMVKGIDEWNRERQVVDGSVKRCGIIHHLLPVLPGDCNFGSSRSDSLSLGTRTLCQTNIPTIIKANRRGHYTSLDKL